MVDTDRPMAIMVAFRFDVRFGQDWQSGGAISRRGGKPMTRTLFLVLAAAVALTVGCVKQEPAPPAPVADASAAAAPAEAAAPATTPADTSAAAPAGTPAVAPAAAKPASAPPPTVADVPDYPGAVRIALSERTEAGKEYTRRVEAEWTSGDPYAKVVEYYQKAIVDKGWTIGGTKTKKAEIEWQLTKGTSVGSVKIEDGTPVTIKIERKDR